MHFLSSPSQLHLSSSREFIQQGNIRHRSEMKLLSIYFFGIFAWSLLVSSDDISTSADVPKIRNAIKMRNWNELLQIKDLTRSVQTHRKAPRFMTELYDAVVDSNGTLKNTKVLEGNIVRSFEGQSSGSYHFFNLTSFRPDERVIRAEFRWFRHQQPFMGRHHLYKVDLYEVLDSRPKPWRGNLISSRLLPVYTKGWEVFNITQMVTKWILNSGTNNGILVVTALPSGNWFESSIQMKEQSDETNAYLVIYSDDGRKHYQHPPFYTGQNITTSLKLLKPVASLVKSTMRNRRSVRALTSTCQRTNLYVDFTKIGWSGWIISPRGYNAYSCTGSCPFPLGEGLRATNHATVRSIMNALKLSQEAGKPCCVPDALHPISLLYFDDEENVVLKQYDDMVAGSCGCH
ncbi:bone morphogenetic protein 2-like [Onychostoma macrolepis]|uniref:bone morphogenetic protein 2-like n=1 Tax=Onychostoma macrolepis TaxID=369639 RepID=UPI00272997C2|nr:bone morphogenetic protein 2-like [Onychostoma macrolepis]